MNIKTPKTIKEPIERANLIAIVALGIACVALLVAIEAHNGR